MPKLIRQVDLENHPKVRIYFIEKFDNGMVQLWFNTHERYTPCHRLNDTMYSFPDNDDEVYKDVIEIEPFLEDQTYIPYTNICKDQIYFMFIPNTILLNG